MNQKTKMALFGAGGLVLFLLSFFTVAAVSGTPMHDVAVIGALFSAPEQLGTDAEEAPRDLVEQLEADRRPEAEVREASASPLRAFLLPSPFSADELSGLQRSLKSRIESTELERSKIARREAELEVRERQLEERWEELVEIRTTLIEETLELGQRSDELERDERVQSERENASWKSMARIFEAGKARDLAQNLTLFGPQEAARILRALSEERASELINEIPRERYLEYAEAYRKAGL